MSRARLALFFGAGILAAFLAADAVPSLVTLRLLGLCFAFGVAGAMCGCALFAELFFGRAACEDEVSRKWISEHRDDKR